MSKYNKNKGCINCGKEYRRADYPMCPYCGGDSLGGTTPKVWKPTKAQTKKFIQKVNPQNN